MLYIEEQSKEGQCILLQSLAFYMLYISIDRNKAFYFIAKALIFIKSYAHNSNKNVAKALLFCYKKSLIYVTFI